MYRTCDISLYLNCFSSDRLVGMCKVDNKSTLGNYIMKKKHNHYNKNLHSIIDCLLWQKSWSELLLNTGNCIKLPKIFWVACLRTPKQKHKFADLLPSLDSCLYMQLWYTMGHTVVFTENP